MNQVQLLALYLLLLVTNIILYLIRDNKMGSCFTSSTDSTSSRNSKKDKASQKGKENNKPKESDNKLYPSPSTNVPEPAAYPLQIQIKTLQVKTKTIKPTEEKPYGYVQPNDDLTRQINKAAQIKDDRLAIKKLEKIVAQIEAKNEKSLHFMQKLAFVSTCLVERYAKIDQLKKCKEQEQRALHIYSQFQSEYFEELIVILNNAALRHQNAKQYDQAIDKYMTIDKLEDKYYSIHDQRKLLNMNNLACLYFQAGKKPEGKELFGKILAKIKKHKYNSEIVNLITTNYQYYKKHSLQ